MLHTRENRTVGAIAWVVLLGLVCQAAFGREVKLTIYPQKATAEAGKHSLLPPPASLKDGDAVPLYSAAAKPLMADADWTRIDKWLALPPEQLPLEEVQGVLERHMESLRGIAQAVRCRQCNWPPLMVGMTQTNSPDIRRLGSLVRLWVRYEIADGNPASAILALRTGFGMARQVGQAPSTIQYSTGMAIAATMRDELNRFVQMEEAPNLYAALAALPKPFVDLEKVIENETKAIAALPAEQKKTNAQSDKMVKTIHDGLRIGLKRWESDLAMLQCVEAIRSYAASHGGQVPPALAEITEVSVPQDPMTGEAFRYTRAGTTAVLESPTPPGNKDKVIRYEIVVKN